MHAFAVEAFRARSCCVAVHLEFTVVSSAMYAAIV
jgi:hypothetical protein